MPHTLLLLHTLLLSCCCSCTLLLSHSVNLVLHQSVLQVYLAVTEFKLSYVQLRELILNGFTASFMSEGDEEVTRLATHLQHGGTVISRQEYLDQVSAYFDAVAMRYRKRNKQ